MKRLLARLGFALAVALVTSACGGSGAGDKTGPAAGGSPAAAGAGAPSGQGQAKEKVGGTLTIATPKDAIKLDPGRTNDQPSMAVIDQIFDTLVALNKNQELVPAVAESWTVSPDGKSWTFKIRKGIQFHDGSELTAEDVAFSFQRILDVPEAESQKRSKISMISKITVVDPNTVRFDLAYPYAPFLGAARQHIVPKKVVESVGEAAFAKQPVGSGPFKFKSWKRDEGITLVRHENYWRKKPNLDSVVFRPIPDATVAGMAGITGEVDVVEDLSGQLIGRATEAKLRVDRVEGMNYFWIGFTQYAPPYNNLKFRQMVAHAIDLDQAIPTIFQDAATRAYGPVAPGLWPRDLEAMKAGAPKPDRTRAAQLFDELVKEGVMTKTAPVLFHVNNDPPRQKLAEYVVTSLKEIGVNAQLKVDEWTPYLANLTKDKQGQMYILGTTPAIMDPDAVFNWLFSSESNQGGVILGLKKSAIDDQLLEARQTNDRAKRETIYKDVQKKVMLEQIYHIPAYHRNVVRAIHPRVHDLATSPLGDWPLVTADANVWVDPK